LADVKHEALEQLIHYLQHIMWNWP